MSDYYLHVELFVKAGDENDFEAAVRRFVDEDGFERLDPEPDNRKHLLFALRSLKTFSYQGFGAYPAGVDGFRFDERATRPSLRFPSPDKVEGAVTHRRYVHVWDVAGPKQLDLARLMKFCADDEIYLDVDSLVVRETQNFVTQVPWLDAGAKEGPLPLGTKVVRVTRQLATRDLGDFLFNLGGYLPTLQASGLILIGYYQNVTGTLNTLTEFWTMTGANNEAEIQAKLQPLFQPIDVINETVSDQLGLKRKTKRRCQKPHLLSHTLEVYETYKYESDNLQIEDSR
jgi:hypothetical protein